METRVLLTFWKIYLGLTLALALYCAVLAWSAPFDVAALTIAGTASGLLTVGLALGPLRTLRFLRRRRVGAVDLRRVEAAELWPAELRRMALADDAWIEVDPGALCLKGRPVEAPAGTVVEVRPEGDAAAVVVRWSIKLRAPQRSEEIAAWTGNLAGINTHLLYWGLWRVCVARGWEISAPFGRWRPAASREELLAHLDRQLAWGEDDLKGRRGSAEVGVGGVLLEDSERCLRYGFPAVGAELGAEDPSRLVRFLELLAAVTVVGVVTAPLVAVVLWLRQELFRVRRHHVVIEPGWISVDGEAEPIDALGVVTLVPVHQGAPMILTRRRALLLGGAWSYEERVRQGRHLLQRLKAMLDRAPLAASSAHPRLEGVEGLEPAASSGGAQRIPLVLVLIALGVSLGVLVPSFRLRWAFAGILSHYHPSLPWEPPILDSLMMIGGVSIPLLGIAVYMGRRWYGERAWAMAALLGLPWSLAGLGTWIFASPATLEAPCVFTDLPAELKDLRGLRAEFTQCAADAATIDLSDADLSGADLDRAGLQQINLRGASLRGASLRDALLVEADVRGVDLRDADLAGGSWNLAWYDDQTRWPGDAPPDDALFLGENARLRGFKPARPGADLRGMNLSGADLRDADLRGTLVEGARFNRADLRGAKLDDLQGEASWDDALWDQRTSSAPTGLAVRGVALRPNTSLQGARLDGLDLEGAALFGANLQRARLEHASLISADLESANLAEARARGGNLHRANLRRANLRGADLRDANLAEAHLEGADLTGARLDGADLSAAWLKGARLAPAARKLAEQQGARFE